MKPLPLRGKACVHARLGQRRHLHSLLLDLRRVRTRAREPVRAVEGGGNVAVASRRGAAACGRADCGGAHLQPDGELDVEGA